MTKALRLLFLLALAGTAGASPRDLGGGPPFGGPPAFLDNLFPPGAIMRYQADIDLTAEQREKITAEMAATQKRLLDLRWRFEERSEALGKILAGNRVDEARALAAAKDVMGIEQEMKQAHLALLIRIKNLLSPAQQEKLRAVAPAGGGFGRRGRRRRVPEAD